MLLSQKLGPINLFFSGKTDVIDYAKQGFTKLPVTHPVIAGCISSKVRTNTTEVSL